MATYDITVTTPSSIKTGDVLNCPYSGTYKTLSLPKGQYKLECWGAQGGYRSSSTYGGKGGYSVGTITLTSETNVYFYTGGSGYTGGTSGGFNGGGVRYLYKGGGGASDIRIGTDSLYARVIVAGGGGSDGASTKGGGVGGGTSGAMPSTTSYGTNYSKQGTATGVAGGSSYLATSKWTTANPTTAASTYSGFGFGGAGPYYSSGYGGAGGGGWYGGGGNFPDGSVDDDAGGAGGSGYVYTSATASQYPSGCLLNSKHYLADASTTAGSSSFPSTNGSTETGHTGDGYIRVTAIKVENGLDCYFRKVSSWVKGVFYCKLNGEWTKDLEEVPYDYLQFYTPATSSSFTYDGSSHTPVWSNYFSKYMTISGQTSATDAGTYSVTFTLKEETYRWSDGTTDPISVLWSIGKLSLAKPTSSGTYTYNTNSQSLTFSGFNSTYETKTGNYSAIEAGNYTCYVELSNTNNTQWSDGTTSRVQYDWSIAVRKLTKPRHDSSSYTYNTNVQTPYLNNFDSVYETKNGTWQATESGSYSYTVSLNNTSSTCWSDNTTTPVSLSWSIGKRLLEAPVANKVFRYNGSLQTPQFSNYDSTYLSISGDTSATNVGNYTAIFTIKNINSVAWSGSYPYSTSPLDVIWSILKNSHNIPICEPVIYTGSSVSPDWVFYDSSAMTISGDTSATSIGEYTATFSLINPSTSQWSDGTVTDKNISWFIIDSSSIAEWSIESIEPLDAIGRTYTATTVSNKALINGGTSTALNVYTDELTKLTSTTCQTSYDSTTLGDYAIFVSGGKSSFFDAFDSSLTKTQILSGLYAQARSIETIDNISISAGGNNNYTGDQQYFNLVEAYSEDLIRIGIGYMSQKRDSMSSASNGKHALFAAGSYYQSGSMTYYYVQGFDGKLTSTTAVSVGFGGVYSCGTRLGTNAIFVSGSSTVTSAINDSMTRTALDPLSVTGEASVATTLGNYAIFATVKTDVLHAYDMSLTRQILPITLNTVRNQGWPGMAATTVGDYALIAGGYNTSDVDAISYTITEPPGPVITDLTGCTWVGNDTIDVSTFPLSSENYFILNFHDEEGYYNALYINYERNSEYLQFAYDDVEMFPPVPGPYLTIAYDGEWTDNLYRHIQVIDGDDVTNTELIAWLQENGTLTPPQPVTGETWVINEYPLIPQPSPPEYMDGKNTIFTVDFQSNGYSFTEIFLWAKGGRPSPYPNTGDYIGFHPVQEGMQEIGIVFSRNASTLDSTWRDQAYRTIILDEPASGDFLTWLEANAVKQGGV